jgi:hypothetical protein
VGALLPLTLSADDAEPAWTRPAFLAAALALVVAAVVVWVARRPAAIVIGVALVPLAAVGAIGAERAQDHAQQEADKWAGSVFTYHQKGRILTAEEARAVPEGLTKAELRARLGPAAGSGIQRVVGEKDRRCVAYRNPETRHAGMGRLHAFCFTDGRYTDLRQW